MSATAWAIVFTGGGALLLIIVLALIWWRERRQPFQARHDDYPHEFGDEP